ncbi:MAG: RNA polymerase sigma factor [Exilibacterium sp.]
MGSINTAGFAAKVPEHLDDFKLSKALSRGDEQAFDHFYEIYFDRVYRFVSRRVEEEDIVQDILQNTLISALGNMESYRGEASMFTWICQIARNELSVHFRRNRQQQARSVVADSDEEIRRVLETLEAPVSDRPDTQSEREEMIRLILLTLDYLPGRYGDILEWKYVKGFSVKHIAEELGQSPEAVQSLLQRARKAFRNTFQNATDILLGGAT